MQPVSLKKKKKKTVSDYFHCSHRDYLKSSQVWGLFSDYFSHKLSGPTYFIFKDKVTRNTSHHIYIVTCSFFDKTTSEGKTVPTNASMVSGAPCSTSKFHDMSWFFQLVQTLPFKYSLIYFSVLLNSYYVPGKGMYTISFQPHSEHEVSSIIFFLQMRKENLSRMTLATRIHSYYTGERGSPESICNPRCHHLPIKRHTDSHSKRKHVAYLNVSTEKQNLSKDLTCFIFKFMGK